MKPFYLNTRNNYITTLKRNTARINQLLFFLILTTYPLHSQDLQTHKNQVAEWEYISNKKYANPFRDISLKLEITSPNGETRMIPAFWAGGDTWKFRFSSPDTGVHTFTTICSDTKNKLLHKRKGRIDILAYTGDNPLYQHGPVKVSESRRTLIHEDGTPFFWLADSWWHGMTSRFSWPDDFKELSHNRKEKGFTVIQFAIGFPCDIEPFDPRGQNEAGDPWGSEWKSVRPEYFDLTDKRIEHLMSLGLMPNIVGAWGYYMKWAGVENMKKHWEYIIARYGAYPVTWTLAGESTLAWYHDLETRWNEEKEMLREKWSEVAAFIQQNDPYGHLLTVHPGPNSGDFKPINKMEYIDMVMCQSGHNGYFDLQKSVESIQKAMELYPGKPIIHGEVCFEGMFGKSWQDVQRFLFWSNILMGTAGFSYGVEGIWQFNTEDQLFGASPQGHVWGNVPWELAQHYKGSEQLGHAAKFLKNYPWWNFIPAPHRIENGAQKFIPTAFCAELGEESLFLYMFEKPSPWNSYLLNGFIQNRRYDVTWFNPITGETLEDHFMSDATGNMLIDRAPVMQDWLLIIRTTQGMDR